jgi:hypothetical protein
VGENELREDTLVALNAKRPQYRQSARKRAPVFCGAQTLHALREQALTWSAARQEVKKS